jgi:hypothetical protein
MPLRSHRHLPAALLLSLTAAALPAPAQVQWEPVAPTSENTNPPVLGTPPRWEPVPGSAPTNLPGQVVWEPISPSADDPSAVVWTPVAEPVPVAGGTPQAPQQSSTVADGEQTVPPVFTAKPELPPPPKLQALNRSIAYSDGLVGPDIGWNVPNGFRWSQRWFGDVSINGFSRRQGDESFWAWNNGDGTAQINLNLIQTGSWSFGINTSFRSVYQGDQAAGGSTQVGEGVSSGFRIATAIGNTGGIAFGGEQIIQWDDKTDTGRNLYLMASNGWWLGSQGRDFPLLIANGGFGTGRFANQDIQSWENPLRFGCINGVENRSDSFAVDNDLCWSPIGSISLIFNEWWGMFVEYRSGTAQAAASVNLTGGIPIRLTWGIDFARENEVKDWDNLTWIFRASLGF